MQTPLDLQFTNKGRAKRVPHARDMTSTEPGKAFPTVKAFAIVEAMAAARRPLGVSELGALLGLPKPTAHRIVRMLESEGLLMREPGARRYVAGPRLVSLGLNIVAASMARAPRHAILEALSQQIGETCNFGVMASSHVVYLDRVESARPFGLRFEPGSRVPLHCTSMGKLFLSQLPKQKRASLLRQLPLYRYTENTIIDLGRLEIELETIGSTRCRSIIRNFSQVLFVSLSRCTAPMASLLRRSQYPRRSRACRWNKDFSTYRCCSVPPGN